MNAKTLVVNPGALCRARRHTIAIFELGKSHQPFGMSKFENVLTRHSGNPINRLFNLLINIPMLH